MERKTAVHVYSIRCYFAVDPSERIRAKGLCRSLSMPFAFYVGEKKDGSIGETLSEMSLMLVT